MMEEIWKDVKGFEGKYQVSNMGRVRSLDRRIGGKFSHIKKGNFLKPRIDKDGYCYVALSNGFGRRKFIGVHRLVAIHFVKGYKIGLIVNHKDEDITNNIYLNLEWCTQKYNLNYGHARENQKREIVKIKGKAVEQIKDGCVLNNYDSIHDASKKAMVNVNSISRACRGLQKHAGGFQWKYADRDKT